jgi:hypothetical protein
MQKNKEIFISSQAFLIYLMVENDKLHGKGLKILSELLSVNCFNTTLHDFLPLLQVPRQPNQPAQGQNNTHKRSRSTAFYTDESTTTSTSRLNRLFMSMWDEFGLEKKNDISDINNEVADVLSTFFAKSSFTFTLPSQKKIVLDPNIIFRRLVNINNHTSLRTEIRQDVIDAIEETTTTPQFGAELKLLLDLSQEQTKRLSMYIGFTAKGRDEKRILISEQYLFLKTRFPRLSPSAESIEDYITQEGTTLFNDHYTNVNG